MNARAVIDHSMVDINVELEDRNIQRKSPGSDDLRRKVSMIQIRCVHHI